MASNPRIFTHSEATAMLPWLRARMTELQEIKRELDDAIRRLASMTPAMRSNGSAVEGSRIEARIDELMAGTQSLVEEISAEGIEIKDIDSGLVDFPALRQGRVIYLCWLISEPAIAYWHELDTGFAGRQPLEFEA